MTIGFLLYPGVEELDFQGPWEMVGLWHKYSQGPKPVLLAATDAPVSCAHGMRVLPDATLSGTGVLRALLVPGGFAAFEVMKDAATLDFVRRQAAGGATLMSVCSGSFVLQAAGVLHGRRASTNWKVVKMLRDAGVDVDEERFTHDGPVEACASGLHACERPLDVLRYYKPGTSRFAIVRASGAISRHADDTKIAAAQLTIEAEIGIPDLISKTVEWVLARCTPAEGAVTDKDSTSVSANGKNKSASASGDSGAATASGNYGAATASGNYGAATASGRSGRAMGADGCALFLVYRDADWKIVHARAAIVGQGGIKPNTWYSLNAAGEFKEVA